MFPALLALAAAGTAGSILGSRGGGNSPQVQLTNPSAMTLGQLFGNGFTRSRGFTPHPMFADQPLTLAKLSPAINNYLYNPVLGGNSDLQSLRDLFSQPGNGIADIIGRGMQGFEGLSNLSLLGAATGFGNSAQPAYQEAIRQFGTNILPQIAETSGLGLQSSGFQNLAGREGANLLGQASQRQIDLDEAASQRMMQLLPIAGQLQAAQAAFPLNITNQLEQNSARPYEALLQMSGLGSPGNLGPMQIGQPTQDSTSNLIGSLGGLGSLLQLFQGMGGSAGGGV